jgi:ribulose kinase
VDARRIATGHAAGRAALGAALAVAPGLVARAWVGRDAPATGTRVITTAMGARDVGIGLGALGAIRAGRGTRPWLLAGVLADVADLVATVRARDELPPVGVAGVSALAAGSAAVGLWLAREVR